MTAENAANPSVSPAGLTLVGDLGDDRSLPAVIHLSTEYLYVKFNFMTQAGRDEVASKLQNNQSPEETLGWGTTKIALAAITELRFSHALKLLEIVYGPGNTTYEIQSERDATPFLLYSVLRQRLAPDTTPEIGVLSRKAGLLGPVSGLVLTVLCMGGFVFLAMDAKPDPHHTGYRAWFKNLIEPLLHKLGVAGTAVLGSLLILGFLGWTIYRWQNPPVAEILKIGRPKAAQA